MELRKATLRDIPAMQALVEGYVREGIILYRSNDEIAHTIRSYTLVEEDGELVGFGALHIYSPQLAEVRSLLIAPSFQHKGYGKKLVNRLLEEARSLGLSKVLALTYHGDFFRSLGFHEIPKEEIPNQKVWEDCIKCKQFPVCNELAFIVEI